MLEPHIVDVEVGCRTPLEALEGIASTSCDWTNDSETTEQILGEVSEGKDWFTYPMALEFQISPCASDLSSAHDGHDDSNPTGLIPPSCRPKALDFGGRSPSLASYKVKT